MKIITYYHHVINRFAFDCFGVVCRTPWTWKGNFIINPYFIR